MSNSYHTLCRTKGNDVLDREIETLSRRLRIAQDVRNSRVGDGVEMWKCGVCGYEHKEGAVVVRHLEEVHNYPEEDACISTRKVYN